MTKTAGVLGRDGAIFVLVDGDPSSTNLPRIPHFLPISISSGASTCGVAEQSFSSDLFVDCCVRLLEISWNALCLRGAATCVASSFMGLISSIWLLSSLDANTYSLDFDIIVLGSDVTFGLIIIY